MSDDRPDTGPAAALPMRSGVPTVLIVDDDPGVLNVAGKILRRAGYEVLEADGGPSALELLRTRAGCVDLLLSDVVMPGMGGWAVSQAVSGICPDVKILFMSAYTEDEVLLHGVRVGQVGFISKPFSVAGLTDKVREVLEGD